MEQQFKFPVPKYKMATIYKGLRRMHHIARKMTFCMSIADRKTYGADLMAAIAEALKDFVIAFDWIEERPTYVQKLVADIHIFTVIVDEIKDYNILRATQKDITDAATGTRTDDMVTKSEKLIYMIYDEIGKVDDDVCKWRTAQSQTRGKKTLHVEVAPAQSENR